MHVLAGLANVVQLRICALHNCVQYAILCVLVVTPVQGIVLCTVLALLPMALACKCSQQIVNASSVLHFTAFFGTSHSASLKAHITTAITTVFLLLCLT